MQKISFLPSAAVTHYSCRGFGRIDSSVAVQFQDVFASSHYHLQKEEQQYKLSRSVSPQSNKPDFYSLLRCLSLSDFLALISCILFALLDRLRYPRTLTKHT